MKIKTEQVLNKHSIGRENLIPETQREISNALKNKNIDWAFGQNMTSKELATFVDSLSDQDLTP